MRSSSELFWVLGCFIFFLYIFISPSFSSPFLPVNNVTLFGDAYFRNNSICLTQELSCLSPTSSSSSSSSGIGKALYVYPIRFLDSATNTTASFSCRFSFSIIAAPLCPFGNGLAFLITSNAAYSGLSDGHMGLPQRDVNLQDSFIAVEFDTSFDPSLGDINGNHIGIDVNTAISFASVDAISSGIDLKSGRKMTAWIEYTNAVKMMRVWVGYSLIRPPTPLLVAQIDLSKHFREFMHVGFSASNGKGSAIHLVDWWRFKTSGFLPSAIPVDAVEEGECLMCSPEDLNDNSGSADHHKGETGLGELLLGLGGLAAFLFSAIAVFMICFCLMTRKQLAGRRQNEGRISRIQMNRVPTTLTLAEVKSATAGFNPKRIIGEGASATVYEGILPSGEAVAVKRFSEINRSDCFRDPFTTEFATMISCLRHKNLVQLQGWCCEGNELVLVYEYLPNGSLDKILHKSSNSSSFLIWERRLKIVLGVASALTYLHEECERQIIHRDVKSCNIMLDADFNAKLGDFGLAEVYEHSTFTREATIPAGTIGYLAPEYVYSGVPTEKTDVYSFGVVVLEVATGRRPVDDDGIAITDLVWNLWEKGKLIEAVDSRLRGRFNVVEMKRMLMVGLSCVHPNCEKRLRVKEAARIIRGDAPPPVLPARKPAVRIRSVFPEVSEELLNVGGDGSPGLDDPLWLTPRTHFSKE